MVLSMRWRQYKACSTAAADLLVASTFYLCHLHEKAENINAAANTW